MRVLRILLPILILAAGGGAFAYFNATKQQPEPLLPVDRAPSVSVQVVEKTSRSPTVRIFGRVETPGISVLTAGVEADIIAVKALEGNAVAKDQVLVVMDDADSALEILQRRAELAEIEAMIESDQIKLDADKSALETEKSLLSLARKAVQRAEKLVRSRAGSEATLDEALQNERRQRLAITQRRQSIDDFDSRQRQLEARRDKAEAALKRAQRDRERTQVTAPFNGRIMEVMVSPGDRAVRATQLVRMYDDSRLELRAQVPNSYIPTLQRAIDAGRSIDATAESNGATIELTLHRLSASVADGQGGVDTFFRAAQGQLPALGVTLGIDLVLPALDGIIVLPPDALYGHGRVYRIDDGILQATPVERLGQFIDDQGQQMLIVAGEGFAAGDLILNSRLPQAVSGMKVQVAQ